MGAVCIKVDFLHLLLINQMNNTMNRQNLLILLCMLLLFPVSGQSNNRENIISTLDGCFISEIRRGRKERIFPMKTGKKLLCPGLLMKMRHLKYIYGE